MALDLDLVAARLSAPVVWTDSMRAELSNLYHLARVALSGSGRDTPYERSKWAAQAYHEAHPEVPRLAAYKELGRQQAWRFVQTSGRGRR